MPPGRTRKSSSRVMGARRHIGNSPATPKSPLFAQAARNKRTPAKSPRKRLKTHAPTARHLAAFYLAVRGLDSPAPSVRYSRARQSPPICEIRRSRDLATNRPSACSAAVGERALRASDLRKSPARASLVEAWSMGDPTVAVSLQRVRPTSRADDCPMCLSARRLCRGSAVHAIMAWRERDRSRCGSGGSRSEAPRAHRPFFWPESHAILPS
jgi:hypothetical protein